MSKNMNEQSMVPAIHIESDVIPVEAHPVHEYTVTSKMVAQGFGVGESTIRKQKAEHADELVEGKHFIIADRVTNRNAVNDGKFKASTLWTKRGVIRLGFMIKSPRAKLFRDAAEDLVLRATSAPLPPLESHDPNWETILDYMESVGFYATNPVSLVAIMEFGNMVRTVAIATGFKRRLSRSQDGDYWMYHRSILDNCFTVFILKRRDMRPHPQQTGWLPFNPPTSRGNNNNNGNSNTGGLNR